MDAEQRSIARRALVTFAAVSHEVQQSNDFLKGIAPLFAAIASDNAGNRFEPEEFRRALETQFGLKVPPEITTTMAPRLAAVGLLNRRSIASEEVYFWHSSAEDAGSAKDNVRDRVDAIIKKFDDFCRSFESAIVNDYEPSELADFLFDFLLGDNTALSGAFDVLHPEEDIDGINVRRHRSEGSFLAARFISELKKAGDQSTLDEIAGIKNAILVSEVVVELGTRHAGNARQVDVTIYLDAPLLMNYLNISGTDRHAYASEIVDGLSRLGARLSVFDHSVDEIKDNLVALLSNRTRRTGPTADAIRRGEVLEEFVSQVMHNPTNAVEATSIRIDRNPSATLGGTDAYFSDDDEQEMYALMAGIHRRERARDRDILSSRIVIARRRGHTTSNPFRSKHLLVTTNDSVSAATRRFMVESKGAPTESTPPALTLGKVAAAVWLEVGLQDKLSISRRQLVAACSRALEIKPDIVERIQESLSRIKPENAHHYEVVLSQPRYMQLAMDYTLGSAALVTDENALQFFDRVVAEIGKDEREKAASEKKALKKKHSQNLSEKDRQIEEAMKQFESAEQTKKAAFEKIVGPSLVRYRIASTLVASALIIGSLAGIALTATSGLATVWKVAGYILSAAIGVFALRGGTTWSARAWVEARLESRLRRRMRRLGFADEVDHVEFDLRSGAVTWSQPRPKLELR